jgi:hypothetical protein
MKKLFVNTSFAVAIMLSMVFVGGIASTQNPFSAQAQTVKVKQKKVGVIRNVYRGGKYVGSKVWTGTKWVSGKTWNGMKFAGRKTRNGAKFVGRNTVKGTKFVGRKTVNGSKAVGRKMKKIFY